MEIKQLFGMEFNLSIRRWPICVQRLNLKRLKLLKGD